MNKVVYVKAFFKPIVVQKAVDVPTGETKKGFFGGEKQVKRTELKLVQTGSSDREIDGIRLVDDITLAVNKLNYQGYEIVSITDVTSGNYAFEHNHAGTNSTKGISGYVGGGGWGYGYGYGYSYTEGVIILAQKFTESDDAFIEKGLKKCPSCAETIKIEVLKCRFCGHAFDPNEVNQQLAERRVKLAELEDQRLEESRPTDLE